MRKCLQKLHQAEKRIFENKHPPLKLAMGDVVWVRHLPGESKLDHLWKGLCEVVQVVSDASF